MAAYKDIIGQKITKVTSNPGEPKTGQMWYNSTDGKLRGLGIVEAWSSSSPLSTLRAAGMAFGTQTATGYACGYTTTYTAVTEEYNGTGWGAGGTADRARYQSAGCGTLTAGLIFGGAQSPGQPEGGQSAKTEEYNGTSWANGGDLATGRHLHGGCGLQDAALAFGGNAEPPAPAFTGTEEYNGSSWTSGGALNTGRQGVGGFGTQTAAAASGGYTSTVVNNTEHYDGTSWTNSNTMATTVRMHGTAGIQTAGLAFGGYNASVSRVTTTQKYDGTTWTNSPATLATARTGEGCGSGTQSAALLTTAYPSTGGTNNTEEFNKSTNTITAAAWASGGNLNTGRQDVGGTGTKSAGLAFGGRTGSSAPFTPVNNSEEYDGTSWTEGNNLNTARGEASGAGTQTAAVAFGGDPTSNATENYNGTSWTTSPGTLNTGRSSGASFGASYTSAVFCGGYGGSPAVRTDVVEEWNGSAWTNATSLPEARYNAGGAGIESAGIVLGGSNAPAGTVIFATSLEYNGSSWTAGGTNHTALEGQGMNGVQTACISYGGPNTMTANSSTYDGTTFFTSPNLASNRTALGASKGASITNTVGFGGSTPPNRQMNNTEEFTSEVETANITDFTTS